MTILNKIIKFQGIKTEKKAINKLHFPKIIDKKLCFKGVLFAGTRRSTKTIFTELVDELLKQLSRAVGSIYQCILYH